MPPVMNRCQESTSTHLQKASLFNRFCASVFLRDQSLVPYRRRECLHEPMLCTAEEVSDFLSSLNIKKATGPDEIPNIFLKKCSETLCVSLSLLFCNILKKGVFLTQWKTSIVCHLYKKGGRSSSAEQYRPISLLSKVSKVLERVVFNRIFESTQHLLSDNQCEFRKKRSTTVQLLLILDKLYESYDQRDPCCKMAYFGCAKAFDKVSHRKLIQKQQTFPFHNRIIRLVGSYLMSRTQKVRINNVFSSDIDSTSGVPQGSVLGRLLFTLFVIDLPGAVAFGDCVMYADDLKIFSRNSIAVHFDVKRVRKWFIDNSMQLNDSKCKLLDYNSSFTDGALCAGLNISFSQKDVVVMMRRDLKWDLHVLFRCRKATQYFFLLKRCWPQTASLLCKLNAYRACLLPILTYASPVWYVNCGNCVRLEVNQKRAMRWIVASAIGGECSLRDTYRHLKLLLLSLYLEVEREREEREREREKYLICYECNVSGKLKITCTADRGYRCLTKIMC